MVTTTTELTGDVLHAGDPGYEAARQGWNRLYQRYPESIVFCRNTDDVVNAVRWARTAGIAFRARSGRHCLEGWSSVDGGLVIDVSRMKNIHVDEASGTATIGTGLVQKEAVAALGERGYAIPTGSEGQVGLGGVVLGGGFGLLTRRMGLACDKLIAAEIVVAEGTDSARAIHVDANNHADLLWACRGGGGNNFGIATAYTVKLEKLADVAFLYATWSGLDHLSAILRTWQRDAPVADERLTSAIEIYQSGPTLAALWYGGSRKDVTSALEPLLEIGAPEVTVSEDSWPAVYADVDKAPQDVYNWKFFSQFVKSPFPEDAIDLICHFMAHSPSPASNYFLSGFGGAVRNEPPGGSAFPHRDALFYCEPGAGWNGSDLTATALGWVADFARALRPYVDGAYVNVPNVSAADWQAQYYGPHVDRLRQVKATYDPFNVFSFEQSVPPKAS
ncbi:FAD-binding oxidoreductase [Mycobacterium terramassiliense]|uniref:FAD/FMN-containing dehydrogenase n=1 Tax=Mycobacterium terramassiliense TaxID=1841859 RepID=A0A2U3NJ53_9MYCO|nr:FAD-binding oxidoreductase [Mycobacterium terramassiliense]SPM31465.1 FAD/FMN-containing dehydrogenase [Mycobacterium terramassiliense]